MRKIVLVAFIAALFFPQLANAQSGCTGQASAYTVCGNANGSQGLPSINTNLSQIFNATGGTVVGNTSTSSAVASDTSNPILGINGTTQGSIGFRGATSGLVTLAPQFAAGSVTLTLPNTTGTIPSTAASPIVLNATTGQLTCPTCLTGSGGTLTATAPLNITANNITLQGGNGTIAQGSGGTGSSFTATPTLGVAGSTVGTLSFDNATSGSIKFQPTTGALGASVITFPAITDTMAGFSLANGGTNASLTASNGGIVYSNVSQLAILSGTATARQMLQSGASTTPAWSTATWPTTTTINQILYSPAANTVAGLATANGGILNTSSVGVPSVTNTPVLGVAGTSVGTEGFQNATSGTITISPPTGALGTVTNTLQAATDTFVYRATADTLTNKTLTSPTINAGALSGTFTGAPTFSGNVIFSGDPQYTALATGTCVNGIGLNSGNSVILTNCPGAATSIVVGTTTITSGTSGAILYDNGGVLGNESVIPAANGGAGTINGVLSANGSGTVSQGATTGLSDVVAPTTWTPSDQSGASLTFTSVTALYTRIGKHVVAQFRLTFPSTASSAVVAIGGLPVASFSSGATFAAGPCSSAVTGANVLIAEMAANTSVVNLNSTVSTQVLNSQLSTLALTCTLSYISN